MSASKKRDQTAETARAGAWIMDFDSDLAFRSERVRFIRLNHCGRPRQKSNPDGEYPLISALTRGRYPAMTTTQNRAVGFYERFKEEGTAPQASYA
jgi:hypothetical protein